MSSEMILMLKLISRQNADGRTGGIWSMDFFLAISLLVQIYVLYLILWNEMVFSCKNSPVKFLSYQILR
jgi:hypothetical protein